MFRNQIFVQLLHKADISASLSNLVLKLLLKDKDERYQSISGLRYDLVAIMQNPDTNLVLGTKDISKKLSIPQKLYGREPQIGQMTQKINACVGADPQIVIIGGYSGIGKTSFADELIPIVLRKNGFFAKGRYDQYNKISSYTAFSQIFRSLINIVKDMPLQQKGRQRRTAGAE